MSNKVLPCKIADKHKWEFVKNVTITKASYGPTGSRIQLSFRGLYKCACGEKRIGQSKDCAEGGAA